MRRALAVAVLAAPLLLSPAPSPAQCVMCKAALTSSAEGRAMTEEFNHAILVMLFAPYAVLGSVGAILMRRRLAGALGPPLRRARRGLRRAWPPRAPRNLRVH